MKRKLTRAHQNLQDLAHQVFTFIRSFCFVKPYLYYKYYFLLCFIFSLPAKQEVDGRRRKIDYTKTFTERNFITPLRAMNEYLLRPR